MQDQDPAEPSPYQPPLPAASQTRRHGGASRLWMTIGILCVAFLLFYGAGKLINLQRTTPAIETAIPRDASPGLDGVIAPDAPSTQFRVGDCLQGFTSPLEPATVVTCETSHNAQFIGSFQADVDEYPGADGLYDLSVKGCKAISLDPRSALDSTWLYQFSHPSSAAWTAGDRTVDCFLNLVDGTVRTSLLQQSPQSMPS